MTDSNDSTRTDLYAADQTAERLAGPRGGILSLIHISEPTRPY